MHSLLVVVVFLCMLGLPCYVATRNGGRESELN